MFNDTYKSIIKELTRKSRRELQRLSVSILKKGLHSKLTKTEKELINKINNFIDEVILKRILNGRQKKF